MSLGLGEQYGVVFNKLSGSFNNELYYAIGNYDSYRELDNALYTCYKYLLCAKAELIAYEHNKLEIAELMEGILNNEITFDDIDFVYREQLMKVLNEMENLSTDTKSKAFYKFKEDIWTNRLFNHTNDRHPVYWCRGSYTGIEEFLESYLLPMPFLLYEEDENDRYECSKGKMVLLVRDIVYRFREYRQYYEDEVEEMWDRIRKLPLELEEKILYKHNAIQHPIALCMEINPIRYNTFRYEAYEGLEDTFVKAIPKTQNVLEPFLVCNKYFSYRDRTNGVFSRRTDWCFVKNAKPELIQYQPEMSYAFTGEPFALCLLGRNAFKRTYKDNNLLLHYYYGQDYITLNDIADYVDYFSEYETYEDLIEMYEGTMGFGEGFWETITQKVGITQLEIDLMEDFRDKYENEREF